MQWFEQFLAAFLETGRNVMPIVIIIFFFQLLVIRKPLPHPGRTLLGFINILIGITFFLDGLKIALFPLGELMATQLTAPAFLNIPDSTAAIDWRNYGWVYLFGACIGFATTLAEPSLLAVAIKAEEISSKSINAWGLRIAVALGVALAIAVGTFRIVTGTQLYYYIVAAYAIIAIQTVFAPKLMIGLALDVGGVTTSTVTVPIVTALGLSLATTLQGRDPLLDGFGLISLATLFPGISVLAYAQLAEWRRKKRNSNHT
ncbi:DUF1538 domain-containing protein [Methylomonas sp. SURF-2]|uniref:DUF1538 domain-containing protein n=1 Tax=Methylomonas subterranea TaxID=2952225 RepID=A0ABT1TB10_9GAMM|nr:DUF1538 domain-containing protein [Methylomonas sp. SURF-2]MCQ8102656.1 DUF1538 domain-containing protein [Methylomonas sp. SURF-2]